MALSRKNLWDGLPPRGKAAIGAVLGAVPPAWILGSAFRRHLDFVRDADRWPAERSRAFQLAELRRITSIAQARTPFYRRTFAESGFEARDLSSTTQLTALPTIDRATLRDHSSEMCTQPTESSRIDYVSTGGTSGTPIRFFIGADRSPKEYAYIVAGWERAGFTLGAPLAVFRGRVVGEDRKGLRHEYDPILRHHYYSNFHMTDDNMGRYMDHVSRLGPCYLHVYPSSIDALARFLRRAGTPAPPNVLAILAESEIVYPDQRARVEETFGCRYFSSYGLTEKVAAAAECQHSSLYHVWPTYGFVELLDGDGRPVTVKGQRGEIVATGFMNTVMPFIRYRTGDFATYAGERCAECGREQMLLADIQGHRVQEHLVANDGAQISWTAMNMHDDTFDRVLRFQFRQTMAGVALLRLIPAAGFSDEDERRIQQRLGHKFDGRLKFSIERVQTIDLSSSGKTIYVDQRIPDPNASTPVRPL